MPKVYVCQARPLHWIVDLDEVRPAVGPSPYIAVPASETHFPCITVHLARPQLHEPKLVLAWLSERLIAAAREFSELQEKPLTPPARPDMILLSTERGERRWRGQQRSQS